MSSEEPNLRNIFPNTFADKVHSVSPDDGDSGSEIWRIANYKRLHSGYKFAGKVCVLEKIGKL